MRVSLMSCSESRLKKSPFFSDCLSTHSFICFTTTSSEQSVRFTLTTILNTAINAESMANIPSVISHVICCFLFLSLLRPYFTTYERDAADSFLTSAHDKFVKLGFLWDLNLNSIIFPKNIGIFMEILSTSATTCVLTYFCIFSIILVSDGC